MIIKKLLLNGEYYKRTSRSLSVMVKGTGYGGISNRYIFGLLRHRRKIFWGDDVNTLLYTTGFTKQGLMNEITDKEINKDDRLWRLVKVE